jgi:hypothetical protein
MDIFHSIENFNLRLSVDANLRKINLVFLSFIMLIGIAILLVKAISKINPRKI